MNAGYVYILSNKYRTTTYVGVTNDIERRVLEHKCGFGSKFTSKYHLTDLIYYEYIDHIEEAIFKEKQIKNWHKEWKWNLVKKGNPSLNDLAADWYTEEELEEFKEFFRKEAENN